MVVVVGGGLNVVLKRMLLNHRGLPEHHMRRACEWHSYMHSAKPEPMRIIKKHDRQPTARTREHEDDQTSEPGPGTGIDWNKFHTSTRYPNTTD